MKRADKQNNLLNDPEMLSLADLPSEDVWLENARTKSPETARYYKTDLLQFKKYFGIRKPQDYREITAKHITQWKLALQYGPSNTKSLIKSLKIRLNSSETGL